MNLSQFSVASLAALFIFPAQAQTTSPQPNAKEHSIMHVSGTFEVKLAPQTAATGIEAAKLGRMTIDKQFAGELDAHSLGEMLATKTEVEGSAGYVAMERVVGTLQGRKGSFALMHFGVMNRGVPQLTLKVVPDSGTEELIGINGDMAIEITKGQHFYHFDFTLP